MARQSTIAQRNLTLTEELERIEQSITLTLQEIDHNFSRAHRIVTQNILPTVEHYADHSKDVWEGSKFWKQFFEASANVSLSGYEETGPEDESLNEEDASTAGTTPSTSTYGSPPQPQDGSFTPRPGHRAYDEASPFTEAETPRPVSKSARTPKQKRSEPTTAPYSSPYESLRRDMLPSAEQSPADFGPPTTPRPPQSRVDTGDDLNSSPFEPPTTAAKSSRRTPANDPLLHRVLDKNWRVQATPHSTARLPHRGRGAQAISHPSTAKKTRSAAAKNTEDDLDSSPIIEAPKLHAEIFDSPVRRGRVPGVSVLTPAKGAARPEPASDEDDVFAGGDKAGAARGKGNLLDSDSEGEDGVTAGMSPPKTMQFHIPQARLMRTPAREASKRIVEDLLLSAGGNIGEESLEEDSPSIIKRGGLLEEDTF